MPVRSRCSRRTRRFPQERFTSRLSIRESDRRAGRSSSSANEQFFVGPDNGIFSYIYDREPSHRIFHVTADQILSTRSEFDIPWPRYLRAGGGSVVEWCGAEEFGPEITDEVRLPPLETPLRIIHIDRFGNCVTNITRIV